MGQPMSARSIVKHWLTPLLLLLTLLPHQSMAAITATTLFEGSTDANGRAYIGPTITPAANTLILAWVTNTKTSIPDTPTFSGNGLTWVQVATITWGSSGSPTARTTLFRAMGPSPSAGQNRMDFGANTQTGLALSMIQFSGVDTSGSNGSGALVQSVSGSRNSATAAAGLTLNLAALANVANTTAGGFSNFINASNSLTAGPGYTSTNGTAYNLPPLSQRAEWNIAGNTSVSVTQSGTAHIGGIAVEIQAAITTLGNGSDPANTSRTPGGGSANAGAFSFQTNNGTDTVTAATVTLATGTAAGISLIEITNVAGNTLYGAIADPASDTPTIPLTTNTLTTTTALTEYRIRITPKSHVNMPAPPGANYAVTAHISSWASNNTPAGSDNAGATVTIDNLSPGNVTAASANAGDAQVNLSWSNPADPDLATIILLRRPASAVASTPVEGVTYAVGNTIGSATVACVVTPPGASCTDSGLTNNTTYHYALFTRDSSGNYSTPGVIPGNSPATPNGCPGNAVTTTTDSGTGSLRECINTANFNPGTTITFNIATAANQSSGGNSWWRIAPTTPLPAIAAANITLDATTQTSNRGDTNTLGPEVELSGSAAGAGGWDGFGVISPASGVLIRGFTINGWSGAGISLWSGTATISGNYIGTSHAGAAALANGTYGIYINTSGNTIGGTVAADRNIIAGNGGVGIHLAGNSNTVQGNYIGVNASASASLANASHGINIVSGATGNTIGGTTLGAGNTISGNSADGIHQSASGANALFGNYIGANSSSTPLPNGGTGITLATGILNLGSSAESQPNTIGPNTGIGIRLTGGALNLAGNITLRDDITLTSGALAMGSATLTLSGNWSHVGATVTPGGSTVILNGANQSITGNTTFNNLTKSATSSDTLTFAATSTTTVNGVATLNGVSGQPLNLRSTTPGIRWNFTVTSSATKNFNHLNVADSDASGSAAAHKPLIIQPSNSIESGNTIDWFGLPSISLLKSSLLISDPVNGTTNPLHIPGAIINYQILATNSGSGSPDSNSVVITDTLDSSKLEFDVTTGIIFTANTSGLTLATVSYAHTLTPTTYTYTPIGPYDPNVVGIKVTTNGSFATAGANFTISLRARVK